MCVSAVFCRAVARHVRSFGIVFTKVNEVYFSAKDARRYLNKSTAERPRSLAHVERKVRLCKHSCLRIRFLVLPALSRPMGRYFFRAVFVVVQFRVS